MKGKFMAGALLFSIVASYSIAYASTLQEKRNRASQLQSEVNNVQRQIYQDQKQEQVYQNQVNLYTASLNTVNRSLKENEKQYLATVGRVNRLQKKIIQNEKDLRTAQAELDDDLRYTYENGKTAYLDVLFQAQSFSDFVSRVDEMSLLSQHQKQTVNTVKSLKSQLMSQKKALLVNERSLEQQRAHLVQLQFVDRSLRQQKAAALRNASLREQRDRQTKYILESQLKLTQEQIQQIIEETQAAEKQVQNPQYIQQTQSQFVDVKVTDLISYAEQFIGLPYVWGGTTPHPGFDCSGFTQYVYNHFGVPLQRTSEEQFAQGIPVAKSDLQPGDLVFFSTYAPGATHVGIYIGNGMMINSEDQGLMVTSMSLPYWSSRYIGARRVMNEK